MASSDHLEAIRRRFRWVSVVICALMASALIACFARNVQASDSVMAEEVLSRMRLAMVQPDYNTFRQEVDLRGILGRWRFTTTVERKGQRVNVETKGAPAFVPPEFLPDLADFEKALADFRLEYKGRERLGDTPCLVMKGVRRPGLYTGALEGKIWIDENEYLIRRTEARYSWGVVSVEHTYVAMQGFVLLKRQDATISPLAMRLTVTYEDYCFGK